MGKLKPIGSEKLQGKEQINRILELSNYKLNIPNPINEDKSLEYSKVLADGNQYHIIKEKNGYVIKRGLNESTSDYIEPMKNRKYYSSYSQALKRLNLITKEVNTNEGYSGNLSLFNENEKIDDKKYILKYGETTEQEETPLPAPVAPPTPEQTSVPAPPVEGGEEVPSPPMEEPMPDEMDVEDVEDEEVEEPIDTDENQDEEMVTFKSIQKLTGKLAQKIRSFKSDDENEMTSEDVKYVINSILSALDLDVLEPEDAEEIMAKFEGQETEDMDDDMGGMDSDEFESIPEPPSESETEEVPAPPQPEGEMAEMYPRHGRRESFEERQHRMRMKEMGYGVSESKVDKVLSKYFESSNNNINKIQKLSESYAQENLSKKLLKKYPNAKLLGKTNKGNLVFEIKNERFFITQSGKIL